MFFLKSTFCPAIRAGALAPLKREAFVRDFPAWAFPLFFIPLILILAWALFQVDVLAEIWNFFERIIERIIKGDESSRLKCRENLDVIYNVLNKRKSLLEGKLTKDNFNSEDLAQAHLAWKDVLKVFHWHERKKIKNCLNLCRVEAAKNKASDAVTLAHCIATIDQKTRKLKIAD